MQDVTPAFTSGDLTSALALLKSALAHVAAVQK
jgi:hypothetical protein